MTVALAYRIPGAGAVMACDGRVTDANDSSILSDTERKYAICGPVTIMLAGSLGKLFVKLQDENPPKTFPALRALISEHSTDETEWMAYDKKSDRLYLGDVLMGRPIAGIGCGSAYGLGALEALPLARTLQDAHKAVSTAMAIACRRNAACGGKIRILTIPRKGSIVYG